MTTTVQVTCRQNQKQMSAMGNLMDQTCWRTGALVQPGLRRKLYFQLQPFVPGNLSKIFFPELQTK